MCGIAGFTQFFQSPGDKATLEKMGHTIQHRGPDAGGTFLNRQIGLCHQRLSIIDLSRSGNQPMHSRNNRYVIVFNGEIYNFPELRKNMRSKGYVFQSHTDTEVILAMYQEYGVECLAKLNGMFAMAIWDNEKQELFLARDRIGKKPLYYYSDSKDVIFASEIKAILAVNQVPREIRLDALYDYFIYQYIPDPKSIFKNIHKLEPGHWMTIAANGIRKQKYWDISFAQVASRGERETIDELLGLLRESTKRRMISDVPLGAFLSGGVDSSGIVAMMAENSSKPVITCSVGFGSKKFDEVEYAKIVANRYQSIHHELTVKDNIAEHIEEIAAYFDEPFADPSLIPTYYVSKLSRQKVKVTIAGDGGDENFAGYEKYHIDKIENRLRNCFPAWMRKYLFNPMAGILAERNSKLLRKGHTLLNSMAETPGHGFFLSNAFATQSQWQRLANTHLQAQLKGYHPASITEDYYTQADTDNHLLKILYTDMKTYLPGDILVKVDRMSMANSLEVRAPILDYQVMEYAATIPAVLKLKGNEKKYILKQCFEPYLSKDILYRKKMGFSVPLANWFRNEIKSFAESRLFKNHNGLSHFFKTEEIQKLWQSHQSGIRDHSSILWSILMFELWWQRYIEGRS